MLFVAVVALGQTAFLSNSFVCGLTVCCYTPRLCGRSDARPRHHAWRPAGKRWFPERVDGAVQVHPSPLHLYIHLMDQPRAGYHAPVRAQTFIQLRGIGLDPAVEDRVIDCHAAVKQQEIFLGLLLRDAWKPPCIGYPPGLRRAAESARSAATEGWRTTELDEPPVASLRGIRVVGSSERLAETSGDTDLDPFSTRRRTGAGATARLCGRTA